MEATKNNDLLKRNAHISNSTIEKDIKDTKLEINDLELKVKAYGKLSELSSVHESKMSAFRRDAALIGIKERQEFIKKLQIILDARNRKV